MSFWERNFVVIGTSSLIAGLAYFGLLIIDWQPQGQLPEPELWKVAGYVLLQFTLSAIGIVIWDRFAREPVSENLQVSGMDERDAMINLKTEAGSSHVYYWLTFTMLFLWFWHGSASMLIHTLVLAFCLGDLFRSGLQIFNYNRAY